MVQGKDETEAGSSTTVRGSLDAQVSAVSLRDGPGQVETQPHTGNAPALVARAALEALEDLRRLLGGMPGPWSRMETS